MNQGIKKQVILFSDPNFLALAILKKLISEGFLVNIITTNKNGWIYKTNDIHNDPHFFITLYNNYLNISIFSYAIFCGGFLTKKTASIDFKKFISNNYLGGSKTLAIFPFELMEDRDIKKIKVKNNASVVFMGDLLGDEIDLSSDLLVPKLLSKMFSDKVLTLGVGELFFPLSVTDASYEVVKLLKSTEILKRRVFLLGNQVSSVNFWKEASRYFPKLEVSYDTKITTRSTPKEKQTIKVHSNFSELLKRTYVSIASSSNTTNEKVVSGPQKNKPRRHKYLRRVLVILFIILVFPFITLATGSILLYFSYTQILSNKSGSTNINTVAKTMFVVSRKESEVLTNVPVLSKIYNETTYTSYLGENISDLFINSAPAMQSINSILDGVLAGNESSPELPSLQIKASLDYIYNQLTLVQVATIENANKNVLTARQVLNIFNFDKYKNLVQQGSVLVNSLSVLLGQDATKNYLVLFQNNMELRPTGGFIGSYGLADFNQGKFKELTVNDIYSADGQLKGHIEPPMPIKKYLGEANWWFRDSNWNPDFAVSAQRAEWFLTKEVQQEVDGVVAIDLAPIKNILNHTGPIFLPDYNLTINADNLYEKTQEESQANFFPGSRKKASFLTALSRVLLAEITKATAKQKLGILKSIYQGLEGRHIQVYLHDSSLQNALDNLSWSGSIPSYDCGGTCYSDFFAEVEANLGVNKSNYFVSRKVNFDVSISNEQIVRNLNINLTNSSSSSLGPSGQYKTYTRVFIPSDATLTGVKVINGQSENNVLPDISNVHDRQEVGVYVEVLPGENKKINFSWSSKITPSNNIGSYGLYIRKQAGTDSDPLYVQIKLATASLTKEGVYTYNTNLGKDFYSKIWIKKY